MKTPNKDGLGHNDHLVTLDRDVALAGFAILESLLISLEERRVLGREEIHGLLSDAAETHREQARESDDGPRHLRVARLIERIRHAGNGTKPYRFLR
ncbi:MAG: hypothetical protein CL608_03465 [Anaerolineaceae bacterium]|nr:hypothetical protein [Anaerolineaceae bacterium]